MSTQSPKPEKKRITLHLVFPDRQPETVLCDSVRLTVKDSGKGKGGGLYGIRPGHAPALFLLEKGITEAFSEGKSVMKLATAEGFARVAENTVTVVTGAAGPETYE